MNRDKHRIVVEVGELDHLLHLLADAQAYKAGKLTNAMIHMHHEITLLQLIEFLECECQLNRPCFVGLQAVLVKTVEDLMICKTTDLKCLIQESLMKCVVYGCKRNGIITVFEDVEKSLLLFLTVTENIKRVPLLHILMERITQQIKILVIERLQCGLEPDDSIGALLHLLIEPHLPEWFNILQKLPLR